MIIHEYYDTLPDGRELQRTYSDQNKYIHKIGTDETYADAVDIVPLQYEYEETDIDIEPNDPEGEIDGNGENVTQTET